MTAATSLTPAAAIDARMVRTRAALRAALLSLIERTPFDRISVRDIVAEAGIGYATFFRHYSGKAALLEEVTAEEIDQLVGMSLPALDGQDMRGTSLATCRYVDAHRSLWAALLTGGAAGTLREQFLRKTTAMATERRKRRDGWLPTELGSIFGVSATVEILAWWLRQPETISCEKVAELLDRLVLTPTLAA